MREGVRGRIINLAFSLYIDGRGIQFVDVCKLVVLEYSRE